MASYRGAEHCNWESVIFLEIAWPPGSVLRGPNAPGSSRVFVRDPNGAFEFDRGGFSPDAALPADAESTGFTRGGWELWTSDEEDLHVFLVSADRIERWPQSEEVGCA